MVGHQVVSGVATLTLDDDEHRNVLSLRTIGELRDVLRAVSTDPVVRVVVLAARGRAFCAGADLSGDDSDRGAAGFAGSGPAAYAELVAALLDCPVPTIARVQGPVVGGGNGLVAACDVGVAVASATFAFAEVRVGVAPAVVAYPVLRRIGVAQAQELFLTGEVVSAARALDIALINRVVPTEQLDAAVADYVGAFLAGAPGALRETKEILRHVPGLSRDEALSWSVQLSTRMFDSEEASEGRAAFRAKRPPRWA
jgi:methylglutaconyl-CoA hydratase